MQSFADRRKAERRGNALLTAVVVLCVAVLAWQACSAIVGSFAKVGAALQAQAQAQRK